MDDPRLELLLSLADDELILGHRLSEWTGWVPYLEADLALSSIAQDELGHARALYSLAVDMGAAPDVDAIALGRQPEGYRNAALNELPNTDYAFTLARQWLYDHADRVRCAALESSSWSELAGLLRTIRLEEDYHLAHADTWVRRLADGPIDARHRLARAIADAIPFASAVLAPLPHESELLADGILTVGSEGLIDQWLGSIGEMLDEIGLDRMLASAEMVPTSAGAIEGSTVEPGLPGLTLVDGRWKHDGSFDVPDGRAGDHTEHLRPLWEELTGLYRAHPGVSW
ncbi:MAG: 1,2-phenylacetyl-CoA epoxidase subunit PaaC [Actinomycetota bacterium]